MPYVLPHQLCSKLLIKCQFDPLNVVAQLYGWSQLQVHAFLDCWEIQQQQCLSINLLQTQTFWIRHVPTYCLHS